MRWTLVLLVACSGAQLQAQERQVGMVVPPAVRPAAMRLMGPILLPDPQPYHQLGLFCKLDVQLERRLGMPVVVRLGDPLQVDAWEGKGSMRPPLLR